MSSNESTSKQTPQQHPNQQQDISLEQKQETQTERKNIKSKAHKKKKQNSDSTSSDNISKEKMQELDFLGGNNMIINQFNQNCISNQSNEKQQQEGLLSQYISENPFQNFLEWSNQQICQIAPSTQQQSVLQQQQNSYFLNQNALFYEKDTLNSQMFNDIKQETNGSMTDKQNNIFSSTQQLSSSLIGNSQLKKFSTILQKKKTKQAQQQKDGQYQQSQIEIEQQQQQQYQQLFYESDLLNPKKQSILNQQSDENSIFNPNLNLEVFQYDTNFSFNPNKMQYSNSFNPSQQTENLFVQNTPYLLKNENSQPDKDVCPFNQLQKEIVSQTYAFPPIIFSEEEPRYVNAAQFKRMMIMRIKRAARNLKQKEILPPKKDKENPETALSKVVQKISFEKLKQRYIFYNKLQKYKYESRHKHATNRIRDSKGRFIPKHKLKQYLEDLEREKQEKGVLNQQDQENIDNINTNNNKIIEKEDEIQKSNNIYNNDQVSKTQKNKQKYKTKEKNNKKNINSQQKYKFDEQNNETQQEEDRDFKGKISDQQEEIEEERKEIYSSQQSQKNNSVKQSNYQKNNYINNYTSQISQNMQIESKVSSTNQNNQSNKKKIKNKTGNQEQQKNNQISNYQI